MADCEGRHPVHCAHALFLEALELPKEERHARLERLARQDPSLHEEVASLLRAAEESAGFLEGTVFARWIPTPTGNKARHTPLLAPGDTLDGYAIDRLLGVGGTAEVYRALQHRLGGRVVALKVFRPGSGHRFDARRFAREARLAARLDHPGLAQVFDWGENSDRGLYYYSMQMIEGPTVEAVLVRDLLCARPDDSRRVASVCGRLLEVAETLARLHEAGIVHCDVKPSNIILEDAGPAHPWEARARLVDFGLLRTVDTANGHSTVFGTPFYAAPELVHRQPDTRADVYGLAATLHDCLAAHSGRPRRGTGEPVPAPPEGIDPGLRDLVQRSMATDPDRRPRDAREFAERLEVVCSGNATGSRVRPARRQLLLPGLLAAVLLGFVLLRAGTGASPEEPAALRLAATGRLMAALQECGDEPGTARRTRLLAALGQPQDGPLDQVLRALLERDPGHARLLAAGYVQRDGLRQHDLLVRFLGLAPTAPDPEAIDAVIARLCLEGGGRPEILRKVVPEVAKVLDERNTLARVPDYALSALAGSSEASVLKRLMALHGRAELDAAVEQQRLALEACAAILRSWAREGRVPPEARPDLGPWLQAAIARHLEIQEAPGSSYLGHASRSLVMALAVLQRRSGAEAPDSDPRLHPSLRAALGDRTLAEEVHRWAAGRGESPRWSGVAIGPYALGLLAGLLRVPDRIRRMGAARWVDGAPPAIHRFRTGLEDGEAAWRGDWPRHVFDPDARLKAATRTAGPVAVPSKPQPLPPQRVDDGTHAVWGFLSEPSTRAGAARPPSVVHGGLEPDSWDIGASYLGLGCLPGARLVLPFTLGMTPRRSIRVDIHLQKGVRQLLPKGGRVWLDIHLDGRALHRRLAVRSWSPEHLVLPLDWAVHDRDHELVITLHPDSDTTLRLYSVTVRS